MTCNWIALQLKVIAVRAAPPIHWESLDLIALHSRLFACRFVGVTETLYLLTAVQLYSAYEIIIPRSSDKQTLHWQLKCSFKWIVDLKGLSFSYNESTTRKKTKVQDVEVTDAPEEKI